MREEVYTRAWKIKKKIEEQKNQSAALQQAADRVRETKSKQDADALTQLILELVKTPDGCRVLDHIVHNVSSEIFKYILSLEKEFNEL